MLLHAIERLLDHVPTRGSAGCAKARLQDQAVDWRAWPAL
jgi:hypothetical protein